MRIFGRESVESTRSGGSKSAVSRALSVSSSRIGEIVSAATTAAEDIRSEADALRRAEGSAESKISRERLVAELADSLVARAEELKRDAANLADVLERASSRLDVTAPKAEPEADAQPKLEPEPVAAPFAAARAAKSPEVAATPRGANLSEKVSERFQDSSDTAGGAVSRFKRRSTSTKAPRANPNRSTEGLRLLATQMAVAGSTEEEIASRLRDEFGVEDATALLGEAPIARKLKESDGRG